MLFSQMTEWAAFLANVATFAATFLGIPVAVFTFVRERKRDREAREVEAYTVVNQSYVDYLKTCLEHPRLSIHSHFATWGRELPLEEVRDAILFEILVSSCESAFFMYRGQQTAFKRKQWNGWNQYMREWCETSWFRAHWSGDLASCYDAEFGAHINRVMAEIEDIRSKSPTQAADPLARVDVHTVSVP